MLEQFDHIETKNLGWLLLRSFVASPRLANSARCLGLKGIHFDRVGFDWWVDDLLKGLFVEGRRNIARLRQELPDLFDVLDRGGPIITSDDTVRALTKWFIDEAHYLDDACDLGLCDCIDIADRNRRRDVEACLRYNLEDFAKLLLPDGKRRDGLGNSRSTVHRNWDAQHETLGWVSVRVAGGKHKDWSISAGGKYVSAWSQALLVQIVLKRDLPQALDWIEAYLDRTDEQPTKPPPEVITRILSRASDQPPHTVTASKPAGAVDVIERPAERPALAAPPPPAPSSPAPAATDGGVVTPTALRRQLRRNGFAPIPCEGKRPSLKAWQEKNDANDTEIVLWEKLFPHAENTGILTRNAPTIDIDILDPEAAEAIEALARERFDERGNFLVRIGQSPKRAILLRTLTPFKKITGNITAPDGSEQKIELLGDGQQVVVCGTHPTTKQPYRIHGGELAKITWKQLPAVTEAEARTFVEDAVKLLVAQHGYKVIDARPKERVKGEKEVVEPAAVSSDIAPASGKRKASPEIYAKWSAAALKSNADKLAAARPGTRNNLGNILAYRMGRIVARGWIKESSVIDAFMLASESNGKILDDGGPASIRATIESGLAAGKRKPLSDLPDRPSRLWQPIDDDDDNMWVRSLRSELRALYRVRFPNNPGAVDAADERLIEIIKFTADPWVIGRELRLTFDEYQRLAKEPHGRRRGARLPGKMKPCDVTREEVDAYRNARKRAADKDRKTKKRAANKAEPAAIDDLDDRASVVLTFLRRAKTPRTTAQIMKGVERSRAFTKLSRKSLRNAVLRLLEPASPLYGLVTQTVGVAKNCKPTKLVAARREGNPATTTEAQP
jgi:hypothetical protein